MSNVQQPEMRRSGHTPLVTDSAEERAQATGPRRSGQRTDRRPAGQRSPYPSGSNTENEDDRGGRAGAR